MGHEVEYATQKTGKPTEVRIYPGANGSFRVDEDENDNYKKGKYATYPFRWNDKAHTISISDINGAYNRMQKIHWFSIILVNGGHESDEVVTAKADTIY